MTAFEDDFTGNEGDNAAARPGWIGANNLVTTFQINATDQLRSASRNAAMTHNFGIANHYVESQVLSTTNATTPLIGRGDGTQNTWVGFGVNTSGDRAINTRLGGALVWGVAAISGGIVGGSVYRLECDGDSYKVFEDGGELLNWPDPVGSWTNQVHGGYCARSLTSDPMADSFLMDELGVTPPPTITPSPGAALMVMGA